MNPPCLEILVIVATYDRDTGQPEVLVMGVFYYGREEPDAICMKSHSVECALAGLYAYAGHIQKLLSARWN